jgi:iron(III) transport system substrate-binding protein
MARRLSGGIAKVAMLVALVPVAWGAESTFELPRGYPRSYANLVESARHEGRIVIYAAADTFELGGLVRDFRTLHPQIQVEYRNLHTAKLHERFLAEIAAGQETADLLISSAMDLQTKLVNDGYSQAYASPEKPNLPDWAVWKNEAYGVSAEPVVIVYNRKLVPTADVPATRQAFENLLRTRPDAFSGKVALYDPARSGAGFLYLTQDLQTTRDTWGLLRAIGRTSPRLSTSGAEILQDISTGRALFAYNMNGAYALDRQAVDPSIGVIFPRDYTLVMSRIALIAREARHPAAARIFLDYLLSARGQQLLAGLRMTPVRSGVGAAGPAPDPGSLRAIHIGPALLANMDQLKRARLLRELNDALKGAD